MPEGDIVLESKKEGGTAIIMASVITRMPPKRLLKVYGYQNMEEIMETIFHVFYALLIGGLLLYFFVEESRR